MSFPDALLTRNEKVVLHTRPHWRTFLFEIALVVAAGGVLAIVTIADLGSSIARGVLALAMQGLVLYLASRVIVWWNTRIVFTNQRVLTRAGVIRRRGKSVLLMQVADTPYRQGLIDRLFLTGSIDIQTSAGNARNDEGRLELVCIPRVIRAHSILTGLIHESIRYQASGPESSSFVSPSRAPSHPPPAPMSTTSVPTAAPPPALMPRGSVPTASMPQAPPPVAASGRPAGSTASTWGAELYTNGMRRAFLHAGEVCHAIWRRHWIGLATPVAKALFAILVLAYLGGYFARHQQPSVLTFLALLSLLVLVRVAIRINRYRFDSLVLTDRRIILVTKTKRGGPLPALANVRVLNVQWSQTLAGRALGYGTLHIEAINDPHWLNGIARLAGADRACATIADLLRQQGNQLG
jgi:membrane protein YdbS with pleckstrin-like domain